VGDSETSKHSAMLNKIAEEEFSRIAAL